MEATLNSGWDSGLLVPLKIKPSIKNPIDIEDGLEAFCYFQENYFVVKDFGGHFRIMYLEAEEHPAFKGRLRLGHTTKDDFIKGYEHLTVKETETEGEEETKDVPIVNYWLYARNRRQYSRIVFAPGVDLGPSVMNLWGGFSVVPKAGNCKLFLEHLHNVICAKDKRLSSWLTKELAYWVQNPGEPGHIAIVLFGEKGWGKSTFVDYFGGLWGQHYLPVSNAEHVCGRFNKHLMTTSVLHAVECFYAGNKAHESAMKVLITDPVLSIEAKGVDLVQSPNMIHMLISSNRDWIIPATIDERRFAVFNVASDRNKDFPYFEALCQEKENGGQEALLHHLLNMDLRGFNPRQAPATAGLHRQMAESLEGVEAFWREGRTLGVLPNMADREPTVKVPKGDRDTMPLLPGDKLVSTIDLIDWAKHNQMPGYKALNAQAIGLLFNSNPRGTKKPMGFELLRPVNPDTQKQERKWAVPPLKEARERWNALPVPGRMGRYDGRVGSRAPWVQKGGLTRILARLDGLRRF